MVKADFSTIKHGEKALGDVPINSSESEAINKGRGDSSWVGVKTRSIASSGVKAIIGSASSGLVPAGIDSAISTSGEI